METQGLEGMERDHQGQSKATTMLLLADLPLVLHSEWDRQKHPTGAGTSKTSTAAGIAVGIGGLAVPTAPCPHYRPDKSPFLLTRHSPTQPWGEQRELRGLGRQRGFGSHPAAAQSPFSEQIVTGFH